MSTYRVRLLDYNEYSQETTFGTCEVCMRTGTAENPTFTFEFTDMRTEERTVKNVEGYEWDWGDYFTVDIDNVALFGDWLEDNTVTVSTNNMDFWDLRNLSDRYASWKYMDARAKRENG